MLCLYLTWHLVFTLVHLIIKLNCLDPAFCQRLLGNSPVSAEDPISHLCWYFKISWVLFSIAIVGSISVTLFFFIFLWPPYNPSGQEMHCHLHVINSVIAGMELFFTAIPLRFWHVIYVLLYGIVYFIFTAIYYWAGNMNPIYSVLIDWSKPAETFGILLAFICVAIPIVQGSLVGIQKGKIYLCNLCKKIIIYIREKMCLSNENEHIPLV